MDMSPYFFDTFEIGVIETDFLTLLQSPEAHTVTLEYKTWMPDGEDSYDPVYKNNTKPINPDPIEVEIKCVHKVVNEFDVGLLTFRLIKEGDSLFFMYNVNFKTPDGTNEAVPDSIVMIDGSGKRWFPKVKENEEQRKLTRLLIGEVQYADVLLCSIAREEK